MIWLTWRRHRPQLLITIGLLIALGLMFLISGMEAGTFRADQATLPQGDLQAALNERYEKVYTVFGWLPIVAPALIGAFWGAPLLGGEYERGTHQLAWTQSVPIRKWLAVKLGLLSAAVVMGGLALSAMVSSWRPIFGRQDVFSNVGVFNMVGLMPAAWWLFAFALGTAAGALLRRTLPAMAVVVATVSLVTFGLFSLSDHYAAPSRVVTSDYASVIEKDARLVDRAWLDPAGRETAEPPPAVCPRGNSARQQEAFESCLLDKGYRYVVYVHPADRFWRFQLTEAAILLAGTLLLGGMTVRRTLNTLRNRGRRPVRPGGRPPAAA
ncbi:hypothetical protein ACQPYK_05010 [Streptosporangium sp. CA-135522]|uniref:hypothetical protein n=1 Tax=Streptosporangium sp. CA-135522 TaxID=3240072 RepID=UPI003D942234